MDEAHIVNVIRKALRKATDDVMKPGHDPYDVLIVLAQRMERLTREIEEGKS